MSTNNLFLCREIDDKLTERVKALAVKYLAHNREKLISDYIKREMNLIHFLLPGCRLRNKKNLIYFYLIIYFCIFDMICYIDNLNLRLFLCV